MVNDEYSDSFSVCFNMMKMKYSSYDKDIDEARFLTPGDKVNVFISFETVMKYLSQIKDIDKKLILDREHDIIFVTGALNLAAHYKRLFRQNGLQTRVFLYYTDLLSEAYQLYDKNDEYRTYYNQKFLYNPRFSLLGESLTKVVIPEIKLVSEFIPGVYFISAHDFEGSLIPMIIAEMEPGWKNLIISGDAYDTQYQCFPDKYLMHYIKRSPGNVDISFDIARTARLLFFDKEERAGIDAMVKNPSFYCLLLAAKGSKPRTIDPIKGFGAKTIMKYIITAVHDGLINPDTSSIELIAENFPEDIREELITNAYCTNLQDQYKRLTNEDIFSVQKQMVDRFDNNSLVALNNDRYYHHQLMLNELTM